ncbi:hypothetical protein Gohar_000657, partial [Gossypium harknessii]|nr:hypothetical protein [Gossypium harknessii]
VGTNEQCLEFCCGLWGIWTSRNKLIYEDKYSTSWDISKQIKSYILELEGTKERVITLEVNAKPRQRVQRANKSIFFDAAFDPQNHRSASGLIVKNEEGRIIEAKSILHDNVASPFAAEAHAGFQATRLGIQLGYHIIDIIGDSRTVIKKCQSGSRDRSEIGAIISDIQSLKEFFQKVRFYFIPRSENMEAHRLAKRSLHKGEEQHLVGETSRSIGDEAEPNCLGFLE